MTQPKIYTKQERLDYYEQKLMAALSKGGVGKTLFEKIHYAEEAQWLLNRIYRILKEE